MGFTWDTSDIDSSQTIKASHVNEASDALTNFINEGIHSGERASPEDVNDLGALWEKEGWVDSKLIYWTEFYGSPAPRMVAQSGQTHFRETPNDWSEGVMFSSEVSGTSAITVPGASTTLKLRHDAVVNIMCSFYMFEFGGVEYSKKSARDRGGSANSGGYETNRAGDTFLVINGDKKYATRSKIYTNIVDTRRTYIPFDITSLAPLRYAARGFVFLPMIGRHQHHFTAQYQLNEGIHDIGLAFEARQNSGDLDWINSYQDDVYRWEQRHGFSKSDEPKYQNEKHIFFLARNMVVDAYYLNNTPT